MWSWYSPRGSEAVTDWHIDSCHWEELVWDKRCFRQPPDSLSQLTQTLLSLSLQNLMLMYMHWFRSWYKTNNSIQKCNPLLFLLDNTRVSLRLWNILQRQLKFYTTELCQYQILILWMVAKQLKRITECHRTSWVHPWDFGLLSWDLFMDWESGSGLPTGSWVQKWTSPFRIWLKAKDWTRACQFQITSIVTVTDKLVLS